MTLTDRDVLRLEKRMRRRGKRPVLHIVLRTVPIRKAGSKTTMYKTKPVIL